VVSRASVRRVAAAAPLQVQAARTVESKKEVVAGLKEQINSSLLVAGMQYQGLSVRVLALSFPHPFASTAARRMVVDAHAPRRQWRGGAGSQVKEIMEFRRALPEDAKFVIAKNTLMQLAVKDTDFAPFAENLKVRIGRGRVRRAVTAVRMRISPHRSSSAPCNVFATAAALWPPRTRA
jgi:hypothetical protein